MRLAVTIDVEEEGLFSSRYEPGNAPVRNVVELKRLDPVFREWDIRPTLMIAYQVIRTAEHRDLLLALRETWNGEIGAHLHPWNTPPLETLPYPEPVPSELMRRELLAAKLGTLCDALHAMGVDPVSFRMGRFNIGPKIFSLLEEIGVRVDSSIAPMRRYYGGPAHLSAPVDPYFPDPQELCSPGSSPILEVPMTILPLIPRLGAVLDRIGDAGLVPGSWISWFSMNLGSLPAQPAWTGLNRLKAAVRLHQARRGRVLSVFFHSSELLPGGSPLHPGTDAVGRFLNKLDRFFSWLKREITVESQTLSELCDSYEHPGGAGGTTTTEGRTS
ncbi:MAG: hypothetical protein P8182_15625 [Deltaproteobacteria bacterium]